VYSSRNVVNHGIVRTGSSFGLPERGEGLPCCVEVSLQLLSGMDGIFLLGEWIGRTSWVDYYHSLHSSLDHGQVDVGSQVAEGERERIVAVREREAIVPVESWRKHQSRAGETCTIVR